MREKIITPSGQIFGNYLIQKRIEYYRKVLYSENSIENKKRQNQTIIDCLIGILSKSIITEV